LFYTNLTISIIAIITALVLLIYNLLKKNVSTLNRLLSVLAFLTALRFLLVIPLLIDFRAISFVYIARYSISTNLLLTEFFFLIILIYPDKKLKNNLKIFILTALPGAAFSILTVLTDMVVKSTTFVGHLTYKTGRLYPIYMSFVVFYSISALVILYLRSRSLENKALRQEMIYFLLGITFTVITILIPTILLPSFFGINNYRHLAIPVMGTSLVLIINYAVSDIRKIDFKKFYIKIFLWLILVSLLLIAPIGILNYRNNIAAKTTVPNFILSLSIFLILFFIFKLIRPRMENIFNKEYRALTLKLNNFFQSITHLSISENENLFWQRLHEYSIYPFKDKFGIVSAHLYIYDFQKDSFLYNYWYGKKSSTVSLNFQNDIISCLRMHSSVLDKSLLYSASEFEQYREIMLNFFTENQITVALPFFDHNKNLIGILFLGKLPKNKIYSKTLLNALDIYRIRFQHILANGYILKKVKKTQVIEHDRKVVDSIKKKIIPSKMLQIDGIRLSSFYMNNSSQGGDYYDTVRFSKDRLCLFFSGSSYSGIESSLLSLELYTMLHSATANIDNPGKLLSTMNWVVSTSHYQNRHASAICLIYNNKHEITYSNASHNPLIIFDSENSEFIEYGANEGVPLGIEKDHIFESKTVQLHEGNIGVIFSDGFSSAINLSGDKYPISRTRNIIKMNKDKTSAVITRKLFNDFANFIQNKKQINDSTLIVFKI